MRAIRQAKNAASRTCARNRCAEVRISARRVRARVRFIRFFRRAERHLPCRRGIQEVACHVGLQVFIVVASMGFAVNAYAQETAGPGKLEIAISPAGATFFTEGGPEQARFQQLRRRWRARLQLHPGDRRRRGSRRDRSASRRISRSLASTIDEKTPNMLSYSGNVVFNMTRKAFVPYATVGVGGLSMYHRDTLGRRQQRDVSDG